MHLKHELLHRDGRRFHKYTFRREVSRASSPAGRFGSGQASSVSSPTYSQTKFPQLALSSRDNEMHGQVDSKQPQSSSVTRSILESSGSDLHKFPSTLSVELSMSTQEASEHASKSNGAHPHSFPIPHRGLLVTDVSTKVHDENKHVLSTSQEFPQVISMYAHQSEDSTTSDLEFSEPPPLMPLDLSMFSASGSMDCEYDQSISVHSSDLFEAEDHVLPVLVALSAPALSALSAPVKQLKRQRRLDRFQYEELPDSEWFNLYPDGPFNPSLYTVSSIIEADSVPAEAVLEVQDSELFHQ